MWNSQISHNSPQKIIILKTVIIPKNVCLKVSENNDSVSQNIDLISENNDFVSQNNDLDSQNNYLISENNGWVSQNNYLISENDFVSQSIDHIWK